MISGSLEAMPDGLTIKGNWPAVGHHTHWKVLDPYEARAVENLIGTIADLIRDHHTTDALVALQAVAARFDTVSGDPRPYADGLTVSKRPSRRSRPG